MARDYIERRETGFYIVGSRVPLDRIVWEYRGDAMHVVATVTGISAKIKE